MTITMPIHAILESMTPGEVSRYARLYLLGLALNGFANGIVNVVLQLYLVSLGFDGAAIALIATMNPIGTALLTIPAGLFTDRYGKGKIILSQQMTLGIALTALLMTSFFYPRSLGMFCFAFFLLGINNALCVAHGPFYSSFFSREDMDKAFGLLGFINILSSSIGSLSGFIPPALVERYGFSYKDAYQTMMIIASGVFLPITSLMIIVVKGAPQAKARTQLGFNLRSKAFVGKFSLITAVTQIAFASFFNFFPYYANRRFGIQSDSLGALYFTSNLAQAGTNIMAYRASKRIGTLKTISASIVLSTPFYLMIPLSPSFTLVSIAYILRLSIRSISNPLESSLFFRLLYDEEKGTANGILTMSNMGSNVVATWLGGQLMESVSLDSPAFLGTALYPLIAASYYFLLRNEKEKMPAPAVRTAKPN